jgi:hypothetical protein
MINRHKITKDEYAALPFGRAEYLIMRYSEYIGNMTFVCELTPDLISIVFGKSDFKYKGEYNCDCWGLDFNGEQFMIISANGRGTTIETLTKDKKVIEGFYVEILSMFSKIDNPRIKRLNQLVQKLK